MRASAQVSPDSKLGARSQSSNYETPYSLWRSNPDWHRLWLNTGVLGGAFVGTLVVLEC